MSFLLCIFNQSSLRSSSPFTPDLAWRQHHINLSPRYMLYQKKLLVHILTGHRNPPLLIEAVITLRSHKLTRLFTDSAHASGKGTHAEETSLLSWARRTFRVCMVRSIDIKEDLESTILVCHNTNQIACLDGKMKLGGKSLVEMISVVLSTFLGLSV